MTTTTHTLQDKLSKALGQKLRKVVASMHRLGAEGCSEAPLGLWLFFDTLPVFRLTGTPEGWGLQIDDTLPEPVDLGESGEIILCDLSQRSIFGQGIGHALRAVWSVHSPPQGAMIGVRFDFGQSVKPLVLNWGDELYMAEHYPADAREDELQEVPIMPV
jgi:hypothetical protein